jgi:hypothetical protein
VRWATEGYVRSPCRVRSEAMETNLNPWILLAVAVALGVIAVAIF